MLEYPRHDTIDFATVFQKVNRSNGLQPIPDDFLPEAEQFLPTPLSVALSAGKQPMQLDIILGTTDLEDINSSGKCITVKKQTVLPKNCVASNLCFWNLQATTMMNC